MSEFHIRQPIFMIGMPRSGTTVLSEAVAAHEDLGWISNYTNRLPMLPWLALLDRVADNPLTGRQLRGRKKQDSRWSSWFGKVLPHPDEAWVFWRWYCGNKFLRDFLVSSEMAEKEMKRLLKALSTILRCQGKKRFFSKLTGPPRIYYLSSIFPDACFIHVLRDPRATVSSLLRVPFWREGGGLEKPWWQNRLPGKYLAEWEASGCSPVVLAAVQWKMIVESTWEEKKKIAPRQFFETRYEDFVRDPHMVLNQVFSAFDLPDSKRVHQYVKINSPHNTSLSTDDARLVETVTRKTASLAGYMF